MASRTVIVDSPSGGVGSLGPVQIGQGPPTYGLIGTGAPSMAHFNAGIPWANPASVPAPATPITNVDMSSVTFPGAGPVVNAIQTEMGRYTPQTAVTEVSQMQSNWFSVHTRHVLMYQDPAYQRPYQGQLVFIFRDKDRPVPGITRRHRATDARRMAVNPAAGTIGRHGIFNLPQINYLFATSEKKVKFDHHMMTAAERMEEWTLDGIVRTEEGSYNRYGMKEDPKAEKTINETIQGSARTFNIWNNKLETGTLLWLRLVRVPRWMIPDYYILDASGHGQRSSKSSSSSLQDGVLTDHPFQLLPWADPMREMPGKELEYTDDFGRRGRGMAIRVGRVDRPDKISNEHLQKAAWYDTSAYVTTKGMQIFLDKTQRI